MTNRAPERLGTPKRKQPVVASSISGNLDPYGKPVTPKATTTVQPVKTPTPTANKASSIGTNVATPTPTPTKPMQPGQQEAYDWIGGPKQTTTPVPTSEPTQPTTTASGTPIQDEWIGQSRTEEQQIQDNINKTQEELNNLKNREDALGQAEYLKKFKELKEYQDKQKEITDKQKAMTEEQTQIQSSRKLKEAQRSLSQLKRNTAYLSSQGLGQSAGALDAFSEQISNSEQIFREMQQYEQYAEEMRKLGVEFDTNAYEQSMKEQQDELDKYVTDTIQTIFNNMSAAEMAGQMDTVDEVDAFAEKYFNSIDTDIANMTRKQIQIAEQKLLLQTQTLERAREFVKNKGIVNKDMSVAQGYYVDGNGQPLISATTGGIIPMPVEAPMDPVFNEKTGQLVTFTAGENGEIIADVQQVIDMPTFGATTIANMAKAVANGTMTVPQALDVLPPASQQAFLDQIGNIQPKSSTEAQKTVTVEGPDGSKNVMQWNEQTGRYDIPVGTNWQTNSGVPIQDAIAVALSKCTNGAQCGKFVNDVLEAAGAPRLVKDSYESKVQAIQTIGEATTMEEVGAGSIFAYPTNQTITINGKQVKPGHIGIVTSKNDDGTINIMDYNYSGDEQQRERLNVNPNEIINSGGSLSLPIIREDTVKQATFDPNKAPQYINYIESGKLPVGMKSGTPQANQFIAEAGTGYIDAKSKDLGQKGFTINNPEAFKNVDPKTLESVNKAISQVPAFKQAMDDIIALVGKKGTELPFTSGGREINQKIRNAQLIAKEIYNLGVLNGPDLALMESIIANPATRTSKLSGAFVDYKDLITKAKETILSNAYAQASNIGLSPIQQEEAPTSTIAPEKKQASDDLRNSL